MRSPIAFFIIFLETRNLGEDEPLIKLCNSFGYNVMKRVMNDRTITLMLGDVDSREEIAVNPKNGIDAFDYEFFIEY